MAGTSELRECDSASSEPLNDPQAEKIDGNTGFRKFTAKRRNVTRACDSCRAKKRRCTGDQPCGACRPYGSECTYNASYTRGRVPQTIHTSASQEASAQLALSAIPYPVPVFPSISTEGSFEAGIVQNKSPNASNVQFQLPPIGAYATNFEPSRGASPDDDVNLAGQYVGRASAYSFLQRAWKKFGKGSAMGQPMTTSSVTGEESSIFAVGDKKYSSTAQSEELELPEEPTTVALVSTYFEFAMPTYRFLHEPTIRGWLMNYPALHVSMNPKKLGLSTAQQAILLLVLATALLFQKDAPQAEVRILKSAPHESEKLFQAARNLLDNEMGKPCLESVQARFAACMYFAMTSRPTQAWYSFGTTVQLITACGFHQRKPQTRKVLDYIRLECEKRVFWAAYTFDMYLSVMYGRPTLIQDDYVDQHFPAAVNDDDISASGIDSQGGTRDSYTTASVLHARLARIAKSASQQQQHLQRSGWLENLVVLNGELAQWQKTIPVILSGMIHPTSLMPIFRRQYAVLQLGYSHAVMLVNRSLLLGGYKKPASAEQHISTCMLAAKSTLDSVLALVTEKHMYPSFWFTQYIAFTALSVVYVWLIQRTQDRVPRIITLNEQDLLKHAEKVQGHLAEATISNAPSLRYSIILEGLQEETSRCVTRLNAPTGDATGETRLRAQSDDVGTDPILLGTDWDLSTSNFAFDPELWQQLDAFPYSEFDLQDAPSPTQNR